MGDGTSDLEGGTTNIDLVKKSDIPKMTVEMARAVMSRIADLDPQSVVSVSDLSKLHGFPDALHVLVHQIMSKSKYTLLAPEALSQFAISKKDLEGKPFLTVSYPFDHEPIGIALPKREDQLLYLQNHTPAQITISTRRESDLLASFLFKYKINKMYENDLDLDNLHVLFNDGTPEKNELFFSTATYQNRPEADYQLLATSVKLTASVISGWEKSLPSLPALVSNV